MPNVFADGDRISGFIDLGKAGKADRWQDLAICYRSLKHNFEGRYNGGLPHIRATIRICCLKIHSCYLRDSFLRSCPKSVSAARCLRQNIVRRRRLQMKHERKTQIRNNYEYAKEKIRPEFLKYDQETMIRRFQLKHDPDYIYLPFVGSEYRISRQTGEGGTPAFRLSDTGAGKRYGKNTDRAGGLYGDPVNLRYPLLFKTRCVAHRPLVSGQQPSRRRPEQWSWRTIL